MRCAKCGTDNPERARFCVECAAPFALRCSSCGVENPPTAKFCLNCAKPLIALAPESKRSVPTAPADYETIEGERKTITALFADIKGSMSLEEPLDPEEARAIVDPALRLMMNAVHRYDGFIVQSTGDGVFAIFGAPVSLEDHPNRAIHAALTMQSEISRHSVTLKSEGYPPVDIRVGINTGEVVIRPVKTDDTHTEYTPIGHSTGLAARLQAIAAPGKIAVSNRTRALVERYFTFIPLGAHEIKGVSGRVEVFEVAGLGAARTHFEVAAGRGLSRFVGRDRELVQLEGVLEPVFSGQGQIAAIVGDAGVGKSRLTYEFKNRVGDRCAVLQSIAVSHGKASPYLPVIELLNAYFKVGVDDDVALRRRKIRASLNDLDSSFLEVAPCLYALLAPAQDRRRETPSLDQHQITSAIKRVILRESIRRPVVLILEDLHWCDDASLALVNVMAEAIASAQVMMLVNYRPEFDHQWANRSYYTQIRLHPLSESNAVAMLDSLLGSGAEIDSLKRLIFARTEGIPFFIEETIQSLFEQGVLARNGKVSVTHTVRDVTIPVTVQGVLASRIDRLGAREKQTLQTAAVIGKYFSLLVLQQITGAPADDLRAALYNLQLGEFIFEHAGGHETEYTFKHALTQEVAYNSLLLERRKNLHARTARALETVFSGRLEKVYGDLARHYDLGGNVERAIEYSIHAGDAAREVHAFNEQLRHWSLALKLAEANQIEESRIADILIRLGESNVGGPNAAMYLDRALGIYERSANKQSQARTHALLAAHFGSMSFDVMDLARSLSHCEKAERLLEGKATAELGSAYRAAGWSHAWMADVPAWTAAGCRALEVADDLNDDLLRAEALAVVGGSQWARGNVREAFETLRRAEALARENQFRAAQPIAINAMFNAFHMGDSKSARSWIERAIVQPQFREHPAHVTFELELMAADFLRGDLSAARAIEARFHAMITTIEHIEFFRAIIAMAEGDIESAERIQKKSVALAAKQERRENVCSEGYVLADLQRYLGMFEESERTLEKVKSVSTAGGYVPFQLRAWEGLAATYARAGLVDKARESLARCREIIANGDDWRDIHGRIAWTEALLATSEGSKEPANQKFDDAAASALRYENFWDRIWRLLDWGDALTRFGDRGSARAMFHECTSLCSDAEANQRWLARISARRAKALGEG